MLAWSACTYACVVFFKYGLVFAYMWMWTVGFGLWRPVEEMFLGNSNPVVHEFKPTDEMFNCIVLCCSVSVHGYDIMLTYQRWRTAYLILAFTHSCTAVMYPIQMFYQKLMWSSRSVLIDRETLGEVSWRADCEINSRIRVNQRSLVSYRPLWRRYFGLTESGDFLAQIHD